MNKLIVFYDGGCPLCVREMRHLKRLDNHKRLVFEDILAPGFAGRYPHIDFSKANAILHGMNSAGEMLYGLDVTHAAWSAVGRGWLTAPLRWPIVRWVADKMYLQFARNRNGISRLLTGKSRCDACSLD